MKQSKSLHWKQRLTASAIHLGISLAIAMVAAALVFGLWYPFPYRDTSGGRALFLIVVAVDVVLGPLITLTVFNKNKPRDELVRDLIIVGLIQLSALGYGLWTVAVARPVHLVFEYDRFRVVHAIEVPEELLNKAPANVRKMPLTGPVVLALRPFKDVNEEGTATLMALQGLPLSAKPDLWQAYPEAKMRVLTAAKPMADLQNRFPEKARLIDEAVSRSHEMQDKLVYLPMVARDSAWTVLLDSRSAEIRGFVKIDSF